MCLWEGTESIKRHTVKVSIQASSNKMNIISLTLSETLSPSIKNKVIIYTNTIESTRRLIEDVNIKNDEKSLFFMGIHF